MGPGPACKGEMVTASAARRCRTGRSGGGKEVADGGGRHDEVVIKDRRYVIYAVECRYGLGAQVPDPKGDSPLAPAPATR